MTIALNPYPRMKDSGVEVLGFVPEHWNVKRLGNFGAFSKGNGGNKDDATKSGVPCVRYGDIYTTHKYFIEMSQSFVSPRKAKNYTSIRFGDVLFAGSGETIDEIGKSAVNFIRSEACCGGDVILFRPRINLSARYFGYAADCAPSAIQKARMGRGITVMHIYGNELKNLKLALPPRREQTAIARFLDHMDRRIQKYIRAKEKLIALLEEYKQALIHQAVTGQIDVRTGEPYPEYKPSGAECFGNLPSHWQVVALRRRWSVTDCKHLTVPFVDCGVPLASVRQVQSFELDLGAANHTTREWFDVLTEGGRTPKVGDLIYCRNVSVGSAALVTTEEDIAMGQDVCLVRSKYENQRWLNYYLHSSVMSHQLKLVLVGSTFNRINVEDIKALLILVPPIAEQGGIASFLDDETKRLDALIWNCRKQQEAMREYRTRLIADVVTGKLDVRKAAAELPDTNVIAWEDGVDTIQSESHSYRAKHSIAEEANA